MSRWLRQSLLIAGTVFAIVSVTGSTARAAEFGVSAQGNFTFKWGDDEAYDRNNMNRGDNAFAPFRLTFLTMARINTHTSLFLEVPIEPTAASSMWLTYLRPFVRINSLGNANWLNMQVGKIPTVFGTFGERAASTDAGLIGKPLLFHYHTTIRTGIVPTGPDFFFTPGLRGNGYKSMTVDGNFSFVGLPMIYDACWDTGIEVFGMRRGLQFSVAATHGTVSSPAALADNYNDGYGFVGRMGYLMTDGPLFGLRMGVSGSYGPYLNAGVVDNPSFPAGTSAEDYSNTALGMDMSFARGPWQFQGEVGVVGYQVPNIEPTLTATSWYAELTRDLGPQWSLSVRPEAVLFSEITSSTGTTETWDYDIWRLEAGINYRFLPGTRLRFAYQGSRFPDAPYLDGDLYAVQLQVWTR